MVQVAHKRPQNGKALWRAIAMCEVCYTATSYHIEPRVLTDLGVNVVHGSSELPL